MPECAESSWEECRTALSQTDCCLGQKLEGTLCILNNMFSIVGKVYCYIKCCLWIHIIKLDSTLSWTALSFELALYILENAQLSAVAVWDKHICGFAKIFQINPKKLLYVYVNWLTIFKKKKKLYPVLLVLQPFSIFPQTPDPYSSVIFVTFLLLILVLHYYIFW